MTRIERGLLSIRLMTRSEKFGPGPSTEHVTKSGLQGDCLEGVGESWGGGGFPIGPNMNMTKVI